MISLRINWPLVPAVVVGVALASGNLVASLPAVAQTTPPPAPPGVAPSLAPTGDPPARVGWLSNLSGSVSFHSASQDQWVAATQNYPVATGDAVWTQPQAAASVMVDSTRLALNGGTELTAQEIDQSTIAAALSQGEVFVNIAALQQGQSVTIATPRGTAQITSNGEYEIYAGDSSTPTYLTTVTGSLQFTGLGASGAQIVGAQQTLIVQGTNPVQAQLGAMQQDQFLTSMLQQIAPPPPPSAAQAPTACAQMTGASVLTQYGTWQSQPSVGTVWFPQVASTWVPYREGRWAYVQPWGWTWVDSAPWGFAPFHYGRWAQFGGRWGWVPQPVGDPGYGYGGDYRPVYAPALVAFLGAAAGAFTAAAFASGAIGWAPLGIHEPYYPPYQVSPRYFGAYNRPYVPNYNTFYRNNVTIENNRVTYRNVTINNYGNGGRPGEERFNRSGATFVPRDAMLGSRPIAEVARPLPVGARAEPFRPSGPVGVAGLPRPTAGTWGVTPALAQREHLAAAPPGAAARAIGQGPAIRPVSAAAVGRPGRHRRWSRTKPSHHPFAAAPARLEPPSGQAPRPRRHGQPSLELLHNAACLRSRCQARMARWVVPRSVRLPRTLQAARDPASRGRKLSPAQCGPCRQALQRLGQRRPASRPPVCKPRVSRLLVCRLRASRLLVWKRPAPKRLAFRLLAWKRPAPKRLAFRLPASKRPASKRPASKRLAWKRLVCRLRALRLRAWKRRAAAAAAPLAARSGRRGNAGKRARPIAERSALHKTVPSRRLASIPRALYPRPRQDAHGGSHATRYDRLRSDGGQHRPPTHEQWSRGGGF